MSTKINVVTTDRADFPDLHSENECMVRSLEKYGFDASLISWHELYDQLQNDTYSGVPVLVRTVWDYPEYLDKFLGFVRLLRDRGVVTVNPAYVIEWNIRKTYLFDLRDAGIPIVPCEFAPAGSIVGGRTEKSVVKPVIGLGAGGAMILEPGESVTVEADSLVNPFRRSIHDGEISIIVISGKPVLYIRKVPSSSDWRVQPQYGGSYMFADEVPDNATEVSRKLFEYVRSRFDSDELLFMRVDLLKNDDNDQWEVLEFEAIDPSMYGSVSSKAVDALSSSLRGLLGNKNK